MCSVLCRENDRGAERGSEGAREARGVTRGQGGLYNERREG